MVKKIDDDESNPTLISDITSTNDLYEMISELSRAGVEDSVITNLFSTNDIFTFVGNLRQDQRDIIISILGLENTGSYLSVQNDMKSDWSLVFDALATLEIEDFMEKIPQRMKESLVKELKLVEIQEIAGRVRYLIQHPKLNLVSYYKALGDSDMDVLTSHLPQDKRNLINGLQILESEKKSRES